MKTRILVLIGLIILLFIAMAIASATKGSLPERPMEPNPNEQIACTLDAMMCPDGSYVGRTGPNCEFSACPVISTSTPPVVDSSQEVFIETSLNVGATGLDVRISPAKVLEDSRCPINAVCIQAGTVRVNATIDDAGSLYDQDFTLNEPVTNDYGVIELTQVTPSAYTGGEGINPANYRFIFRITKKAQMPI